MGMHSYVKGIKSPDAPQYIKYKTIWDACKDAGVDIPNEVERFFDYEPPDNGGIVVDIPSEEWNDHNSRDGIEVRVSDIPSDVTIIRFINSY
jgi:hypothetical protein